MHEIVSHDLLILFIYRETETDLFRQRDHEFQHQRCRTTSLNGNQLAQIHYFKEPDYECSEYNQKSKKKGPLRQRLQFYKQNNLKDHCR